MNNKWHGLLKIIEINKTDCNGKIVWQQNNILNMFHLEGEEFILNSCFVTGGSEIPTNYFFGLDNRTSLAFEDDLAVIASSGEPNSNGYARIATPSTGVFIPSIISGHQTVSGPILTFAASGGSYGPVKNLFLATTQNNTGYLISSVALNQVLTLANNEAINVRMRMSLANC